MEIPRGMVKLLDRLLAAAGLPPCEYECFFSEKKKGSPNRQGINMIPFASDQKAVKLDVQPGNNQTCNRIVFPIPSGFTGEQFYHRLSEAAERLLEEERPRRREPATVLLPSVDEVAAREETAPVPQPEPEDEESALVQDGLGIHEKIRQLEDEIAGTELTSEEVEKKIHFLEKSVSDLANRLKTTEEAKSAEESFFAGLVNVRAELADKVKGLKEGAACIEARLDEIRVDKETARAERDADEWLAVLPPEKRKKVLERLLAKTTAQAGA